VKGVQVEHRHEQYLDVVLKALCIEKLEVGATELSSHPILKNRGIRIQLALALGVNVKKHAHASGLLK
jgi:hypothetical protein